MGYRSFIFTCPIQYRTVLIKIILNYLVKMCTNSSSYVEDPNPMANIIGLKMEACPVIYRIQIQWPYNWFEDGKLKYLLLVIVERTGRYNGYYQTLSKRKAPRATFLGYQAS